MKKIISFIITLVVLNTCNLYAQDLKTCEKQKDALKLALKINSQKIKLAKLDQALEKSNMKADRAKKKSLKAANKVVSNSNDGKETKLVEKSTEAANNVQDLQVKTNKIAIKIAALKDKIKELESLAGRENWNVQLLPQNQ